jgi:hypothetical protein
MWLFAALLASAAPAEELTPEWGLGAQVGIWGAESAAPQLGGHVAVRPARWITWQGFLDSSGRTRHKVLQLDHVIGFHAIFPVFRWNRGSVGPSLGSCVDFRSWRRTEDLAGLRTDVLFGPRAGLHLEHRVDDRWTVQGTATAMLYVGNTQGTYAWGEDSTALRASPAVQSQVSLTRWFDAK